eukprot:SAG11_NODE_1845_length_4177_cov_2.602256_1_plen_104_part_00
MPQVDVSAALFLQMFLLLSDVFAELAFVNVAFGSLSTPSPYASLGLRPDMLRLLLNVLGNFPQAQFWILVAVDFFMLVMRDADLWEDLAEVRYLVAFAAYREQ